MSKRIEGVDCCLKIPRKSVDRLTAIAKEVGIPRNEIIRQAITQYLLGFNFDKSELKKTLLEHESIH